MKTNESFEYAETYRIALWTALAVALGILVHRIFFLVALVAALIAPLGLLRKHEQQTARSR